MCGWGGFYVMAMRLAQLRTKATELVSKHDVAYYKEVMENNKHHVVQPPPWRSARSSPSSCSTPASPGWVFLRV
ncbi:hypothetical protein GUJ93_ZPchr0007g5367 [Zizania palustris]|uniref:Uncharacterized protein n=1 Tax=Zizania palustris TaxID=103762 RepID=A0A8J5VRA7_ZIZPA|nr:hypothetical protein GUJ93_ZPchr0007g5367 [Zizania palustris]